MSAEVLVAVAVATEKLRRSNPMNGDGFNYALTEVLNAIVRIADEDGPLVIAAIEAERAEKQRRDDITYWHYVAINARAQGDGELERRALDQMALLERAAAT